MSAARADGGRSGLYRFDPSRDLAPVVDLLKECFQDELDAQDQRWLADLSALTRSSSLLGLLVKLFPGAHDMLSGFVFYAKGELVGNVNVLRVRRGSWVIANVATDPRFRRQGIGRELVEAALELAEVRGAEVVGLQVRQGNAAARRLYETLGFSGAGAVHALTAQAPVPLQRYSGSRPADRVRIGPGEVGPGEVGPGEVGPREVGPREAADPGHEAVHIEPWSDANAPAVRRTLARADALEGPWPPGPLTQSWPSPGLSGWFDDLFRGRQRVRLLARRRGVGAGVLAGFQESRLGPHRLEVAVDPGARGTVEGPLLDAALSRLADQPMAVTTEVGAGEADALAALKARGFKVTRTLDRMVLRMGGVDRP